MHTTSKSQSITSIKIEIEMFTMYKHHRLRSWMLMDPGMIILFFLFTLYSTPWRRTSTDIQWAQLPSWNPMGWYSLTTTPAHQRKSNTRANQGQKEPPEWCCPKLMAPQGNWPSHTRHWQLWRDGLTFHGKVKGADRGWRPPMRGQALLLRECWFPRKECRPSCQISLSCCHTWYSLGLMVTLLDVDVARRRDGPTEAVLTGSFTDQHRVCSLLKGRIGTLVGQPDGGLAR